MLLRRQVSEERDEHIDMTPMVDVVFQLMTFMLFSVQMTGSEVAVPVARHGVGVEENGATFVTVFPPESVGADPRMILGPKGDGPNVGLDQVKKAVADGLRQGLHRVVLQADGNVPHGVVLKTAAAISEVEGVTLHIGVQEPE